MAIVSSLGVAVPASADPTKGTIAGHLTDGGMPVPGISVFVTKIDGGAFSYSNTDSSGFYRTSELPPGDYKVEFDLRWGRQYAYQSLNWVTAPVFTITAGNELVVDDSVLPTGSLSGRLTEQDGQPIAGASVYGVGSMPSTTDSNGQWQIPRAFAGTDYVINFSDWRTGLNQYAIGKVDYYEANRITVVAGQNTVVDDVRLPTGSLKITAVDSVTGAALDGFFGYVGMRGGSAVGGEIILHDVPIGSYSVGISLEHYLEPLPLPRVTVAVGQQSEIQVRMDPEAIIQTTVVDAATGAPLAGVCVTGVMGEMRPTEGCGNVSDSEGHVSLSYLRGGSYQLLAFPTEAPGYGTQWVGANGGTGKQHLAAKIEVAAGQTANAPVIKMDRAGAITGRVTTSAGVAPDNGWVGIFGVIHGSGEVPPGHSLFDTDGRYTLENLGPYDWQLFFNVRGEAPQYSGGVANRLLARAVKVTAGGTATYDQRLRAGVTVTVNIAGTTSLYPSLRMYNAVTGDLIAQQEVNSGFTTVLPVVGPQFVKIAVDTSSGRHWIGGTDLASANLFFIPGAGSKTINVSIS
ncbi:carboxypeptidase regulatory-like domain-containing protein [Rhizocola hellebori]|uniref:carboxypeptidase regulatory-like domain-containing protein n=1 Tax=Rhizocola hellebori TaxID=1392758 RepID=UPI0019403A52|nr:carboxypeptidase regulatory-like domain-containing protein [Rhizocola hellebori]